MRALLILAITLCASATPMLAQTDSLIIGPGDQVHVEVFDTPELSSTARVDDKGNMPLLMGGSVHIGGMTSLQAADEIQHTLVHRRLMNSPQVLVTIQRFATQKVAVFGQVAHPATYEIDTPRPLTELLAEAGGFTELADHHVSIRRTNGKPNEQVFVSNDPATDLGANVYIYPGDSVIVPKQNLIYVLGDVNRAGGFPMNNDVSGITVLQAVASAGGAAHTANTSHARLIRRENGDNYKEIPLNLSAMQKGKKPDMAMQANDIIYIPFDFIKNAALGITGVVAAGTSAVIYAK